MEMEESRWSIESGERNWAGLPMSPLEIIMQKLSPFVLDLFRFSIVCRNWYFTLPKIGSCVSPLLLLPNPTHRSETRTTRQMVSFSSPTTRPVYYLFDLPEEGGGSSSSSRDYLGLNHIGWFLVVNGGVMSSPFLFNPLTLSRIPLPPLPFPTIWNQCHNHPFPFRHDDPPPPNPTAEAEAEADDDLSLLGPDFYLPFLSLAVLSSNPFSNSNSNSDLEIMVVHGWDSRLAFYRLGSETKTWTTVVHQYNDQKPLHNTKALAYFDGHFYAIDGDHDTLVCCDTSSAMATVLLPLPWHVQNRKMKNFVCFLSASHNGLLLIIRHFLLKKPSKFLVYKLVEEQEQLKWLHMDSIGRRALFISQSNSFEISENLFFGVYPDCIYFADFSVEEEYRSKTSLKLLIYSLLKDEFIGETTLSPSSFLCVWRSMWFHPSLA